MKNPALLHLLGWAIATLAVAMLTVTGIAAGYGESRAVATFMVSALIAGFLAGGLLWGFRGRSAPITREQSMVLLILLWTILPLCAAIPFYVGLKDTGFLISVFEATSGLTTTGTTLFQEINDLPRAMVFWRALLQWLGGGLNLLAVVLILSPSRMSGLTGPNLSPLSQIEHHDMTRRVLIACRTILPVYGILTLICIFLLWVSGVPEFDALSLGLSTISTGGFMPRDGTVAQYGAPMAEFVLVVFMVLGAMSFLVHRAQITGIGSGHQRYAESRFFLVIILFTTLVLSLLVWGGDDFAVKMLPDALRTGLFRAISLATTTGFDNAPASAVIVIPFAMVLMVTIIGGCAYSTAGGIKTFRFAMMLNQSRRELARLMHPHSVTTVRSAEGMLNPRAMTPIWVLFAVYVSFAVVLSVILAFDGLSLEASVLAAAGALSNAGPAVDFGVAGGVSADMTGVSALSLVAYTVAMVLGRLEMLAALSLVTTRLWRV